MTEEKLPEVIEATLARKDARPHPLRGEMLDHDKKGVYLICWPGGTQKVKKKAGFFGSIFFIDPGYEVVTLEDHTESFYYEGVTSIHRYPSLKEIKYGSDLFEEVRGAINRHFIRQALEMPHPFDKAKSTPPSEDVETEERAV